MAASWFITIFIFLLTISSYQCFIPKKMMIPATNSNSYRVIHSLKHELNKNGYISSYKRNSKLFDASSTLINLSRTYRNSMPFLTALYTYEFFQLATTYPWSGVLNSTKKFLLYLLSFFNGSIFLLAIDSSPARQATGWGAFKVLFLANLIFDLYRVCKTIIKNDVKEEVKENQATWKDQFFPSLRLIITTFSLYVILQVIKFDR